MALLAAVCASASHQQALAFKGSVGSAVMPARPAAAAPVPSAMDVTPLVVALPPLSAEERAEVEHLRSWDGPLRLGSGRALRGHATVIGASEQGSWQPTPRGRHAIAWRVTSPGAVGVRLALVPRRLPDDALVWAYAPGKPAGPPISGSEINASLRRNLDAGAADDAAALFWMPLTLGDTVSLQVELPAGASPTAVAVEPAQLSHIFRLPFLEEPDRIDPATDRACSQRWDAASRATALLLFTDADGATGACTGTLVNDADPDTFIPHVLTAHHCFHDQVRASSIESLWFLRPETCGGHVGAYAAVSGGADVLRVAKSTDTSLLRLRRPPAADAVFIGLHPDLPPIGAELASLHHPLAGRQRVAVGVVSQYLNCADVANCADGADPDAIHFVRLDRRQGATRAGSSGCGLFTPSQQLVGVLLGGSDEGDAVPSFDYYGRLDVPSLRRWLGVGGSAN